jgi:hypothetical protein
VETRDAWNVFWAATSYDAGKESKLGIDFGFCFCYNTYIM